MLVAADRNCRAFITQHDFRDPRRHNADTILAGIVPLDDGDIGVTHVLFQLGSNIVKFFAALFGELRHWHACDARGRPQKDLGGAVVADHLRLYAFGIDAEMFAEMHAKSQPVEMRSRTKSAIVPGCFASNVGKRIGRIRNRDQHRVRSGANDVWDNVAINRRVLVKQPEPSLWIVAVGGAAGLFVDSRRNENDPGSGKRVKISVLDIDGWRKRNAVADVSGARLRRSPGTIDKYDLSRAASRYRCQRDCASDIAGADDAEFHAPVSQRFAGSLLHEARAGGAINSGPTGSVMVSPRISSISALGEAPSRQPGPALTGSSWPGCRAPHNAVVIP